MFLKSNKDKIKKTVIKIPSDIKYIRKISSKVLEAVASQGLDDSIKYDIRLCVEEAVINAIVHGNGGDRKKPVKVTYWMKDGNLNIEVEDRGSGFDHNHICDPTANENIMKGCGRGVYLIKTLMDKVEYNASGNAVHMIKHIRER